jgi:hypothetical protein
VRLEAPTLFFCQEEVSMNGIYLSILAASLLATSALAQEQTQTGAQAAGSASTSASAQTDPANAAIASGTEINAALSSSVDSKKAKPGDQVTAHSTEAVKREGRTIVPKGAKLVGHVTRALPRGKGETESTLGIVFDKAILKDGQEIALNGGIQALAIAQPNENAGADLDSMANAGAGGGSRGASGGRGAMGGVASTAGGAVGSVANTAGSATSTVPNTAGRATAGVAGSTNGAIGGVTSSGQFASNSRGVFGLDGLNLTAAGADGSMITSGGKNVHLDSGTRMLIVAGTAAQDGQAPTPASNKNSKPPKAPAH